MLVVSLTVVCVESVRIGRIANGREHIAEPTSPRQRNSVSRDVATCRAPSPTAPCVQQRKETTTSKPTAVHDGYLCTYLESGQGPRGAIDTLLRRPAIKLGQLTMLSPMNMRHRKATLPESGPVSAMGMENRQLGFVRQDPTCRIPCDRQPCVNAPSSPFTTASS